MPLATPAGAGGDDDVAIVAAGFGDPTTRYDHAILGDDIEWGALRLRTADGRRLLVRLPTSRVFEDTAPRLADVDGDGAAEVIVVETDLSLGASLAVYDAGGLVARTPFIGRPHRWLAPVGAADLDGDGRVEIAYVDRPHLLRRLRVVRLAGGRLHEIAAIDGVTNHRIGDRDISGGVRDCGTGPEMVLLDPGWRRILVARLRPAGGEGAGTSAGIVLVDAGPNAPGRLAAVMACREAR
ncbi:MAG: VCBS repeat-containing protein [Alphaproteobacteria bacterium]|nr:MAG: VCBS repeat-containing protein [Alphaproteobacteria bacterium]